MIIIGSLLCTKHLCYGNHSTSFEHFLKCVKIALNFLCYAVSRCFLINFQVLLRFFNVCSSDLVFGRFI